MLFWYNLDFLNDQNYEEFQNKWREAIWNQRSTKTEEFMLLWKFRSQKSHPTKRGFPCEKFLQPQDPPCETTPRHMCAILQPKSPFRSYEMSCETTCEIPLLLRKFQPSFEYLFKPLNSYVSFRTAILTYEKPLQVQNSTKIRGPFPREVQRTSI